MLNGILVFLVVASVVLAALTGGMQALTAAIVDSARDAVSLALRLIGVMALFLGLMRVAADGGLLRILARALGPVLRRLFPEVPADHPAMSAMILNMSANMLGLGNAATPFGIKAMQGLDALNAGRGTATDAMVTFLAINTSALTLFPAEVIGLRAAAGSQNATGIIVTTWVASGCATVAAVVAALLLARLPRYRATKPAVARRMPDPGAEPPPMPADDPLAPAGPAPRPIRWRALAVVAIWLVVALAFGRALLVTVSGPATLMDFVREDLSSWILPLLVAAVLLFGWSRSVRVYESMVEGAKEGFHVAVRIIPYLVVILVAVGMFRESGGIGLLERYLGPLTSGLGMPAEALPMAAVRPLSGSGAWGVMTEIMRAHGPDSLLGYMVSTMSGSTDTTFYILAVYFGAVGIKRTRHALPACLLADAAGIFAAVAVVNVVYG